MSTHVCFFIDTHVMGGAEQYGMDLIEGCEQRGHRVSIICHDFVDLVQALQNAGLPRKLQSIPSFPSITRTQLVQGGLSRNRASGGQFNLLKIPGLCFYYFNMLRSYWPLRNYSNKFNRTFSTFLGRLPSRRKQSNRGFGRREA